MRRFMEISDFVKNNRNSDLGVVLNISPNGNQVEQVRLLEPNLLYY